MSRTLRKDKYGKEYKEGNPVNKLEYTHKCKCFFCTGVNKRSTSKKIALKEMAIDIKEYSSIG